MNYKSILFFLLVLSAIGASFAHAAPPIISYSGKVSVDGQPFTGTGLFKFAILNAENNATLWSNDGTSVNGSQPSASVGISVNGGLYSILLGNNAISGMGSIHPTIFEQHNDTRLRIWFSDGQGFEQLFPDRRFASVPYAMNAEIIDGSISASKLVKNTITTTQLNEQILKYLKPEITNQPLAQTVYADTNVSFSVNAQGKFLSYQWRKDGVDLNGETNATLAITDANATNHDGNYTVVVSNDFGSVEKAVISLQVSDSILNGLVGYWPFNGNALDMSGNNNHGTVLGASLTNDRLGRSNHAYNFNGTSDYILVNHNANLSLTTFSFSVWYKSTAGGTRIVITKDNHNSENYSYWSGGWTQFQPNNAVSMVQAYTGTTIQLNQYYHIAVSKSGSSLKIFLNGILKAQTALSSTPTLNNQPLYFGHDGGFGYPKFQGTIDDIRIYNRAISDSEVQSLYNLVP